jgi:hypothetical protein
LGPHSDCVSDYLALADEPDAISDAGATVEIRPRELGSRIGGATAKPQRWRKCGLLSPLAAMHNPQVILKLADNEKLNRSVRRQS